MPEPTRSGLSDGAEVLVRRLESRAESESFDCDVLIVGSGYGGAVAAARLAGARTKPANDKTGERAVKVWLLERGQEYQLGRFPSRFSELAGHVRFNTQNGGPTRGRDEGLFDFRIGGDVSALLGNGLGGGSLINAGVMEKPDPAVFDTGWPAGIDRTSLDDAYRKALAMLLPQTVDDDDPSLRWAAFQKLAEANGTAAQHCAIAVNLGPRQPSAAQVMLETCTRCGDCVTGCNQGAKGTLDTNYLAWAHAGGVEMYCGAAVQHVLRDVASEGWLVTWHFTERSLRRGPAPPRIRARQVVLAAGSFGSTEILLRSREQGLPVSGQLGCKFSTNGDFLAAGVRHKVPVHATADQETDPADAESRRVFPTITGLVRVPQADGRLPIAIEEFAVPAALRHVFGELASTLDAWTREATEDEAPAATDPMAVTDASIERCSLYGLMGDDEAEGRLLLPDAPPHPDAFEGVLSTQWSKVNDADIFARQSTWLTDGLLPLCDAERPMIPQPLHTFKVGALTVHPLGGCAMGNSASDGVVDPMGRVFRLGRQPHPGLVVLDGSIVPRALGINPSLTIAALAERAMPELIDEWGMVAVDSKPPRLERRIARRLELPTASADWLIRERLRGTIKFADGTYWAELEIEFEPIPGFAKALSIVDRRAGVRRATLKLWQVAADTDAFSWQPGQQAPRCTAQLTGSVGLFERNDAANEPPLRLAYRLSVQSLVGEPPLPIGVGGRLDGVKRFGQTPGEVVVDNPWRQLTEMDVRYDGSVGTGHWSLDFDDLADRREPLLRLIGLSTMPDALGDGGALLLYGLRQSRQALKQLFGNPLGTIGPHHLNERFPSSLPECPAEVHHLNAGARLTRFWSGVDKAPCPALLIHGLGTSGSSFAHPCMPNSLVRHLLREGRDVWVLDLRSSVGNERNRHNAGWADWTVDSVAEDDIPAAVLKVVELSGKPQVDVVAHCMGAVMFCFAALGSAAINDRVHAVVLSQVGPLARLSPLNRLRGYLATYLRQYLRIDELDTSPEFESEVDAAGKVTWKPSGIAPFSLALRDLLPNTFPYPDDDKELERQAALQSGVDFRPVRHRADMIFGQLFDIENVADETLEHLDAFFGWVKVRMLAQALHFARQNMLTDARGRNTLFDTQRFKDRFRFPLLIIHGRRNRVFDWRGSLDSLKLLKKLRQEDDLPTNEHGVEQPSVDQSGCIATYGEGTLTRLALIKGYGHLDCMIGKDAHRDVFPTISAFLATTKGIAGNIAPAPNCEEPWMGPMLGWLRSERTKPGPLLRVSVLVQPQPRRARTRCIAIVPVTLTGNGPVVDVTGARILRPIVPGWRYRSGMPDLLVDKAVELVLDATRLNDRFDTFALVTIHEDLPPLPGVGFAMAFNEPAAALSAPSEQENLADLAAMFSKGQWLLGSEEPNESEQAALQAFLGGDAAEPHLQNCLFTLPRRVRDAADTGVVDPGAASRSLRFALASCQYPPGLLDEVTAGASYARLQREAESSNGPQFALLIGDQIYADATAGVFEPTVVTGDRASAPTADLDSDFDRSYELNWRLPAMRRTAAHIPMWMMLDDHEVSDNWQPRTPRTPLEEAGLAAYERYQRALNPRQPLSGDSSYAFQVFPAGIPFWVLDTRTQRQPRQAGRAGGNGNVAIEQADIIPQPAMEALCKALRSAPPDCVKFIVSPSPILPPERFERSGPDALAERLRSDNWSGYPKSAAQLLRFIRDADIRRVVILAGDAHLSSVSSFAFDDDKNNRVISIVSSGLYTPWPFANQRPDSLLLDGMHDLGDADGACSGRMTLHAMSAEAGYATVSVLAKQGRHTGLQVNLHAGRGGETRVVDMSLDPLPVSASTHPPTHKRKKERKPMATQNRTCICKGNATLWSTHADFPGPKVQPFEFEATFEGNTGKWKAAKFVPIVIPDINTPFGKVKLTVKLSSTTNGSWNAQTGAMSIKANFAFSFDLPLIGGSTLAIVLDTATHPKPPQDVAGVPLNAAGKVKLAGVDTFKNGVLNGVRCAISLEGTFTPHP